MNLGVALRLGRVSNLPTVWTNVLTGLVLGGAYLGFTDTLYLGFCLSLFYVGGMYLNDAFDKDIDARERPERPIPSGQVKASTVFYAGFAMLLFGCYLLWRIDVWCALAGVGLAATITYYDSNHKNNPLSPVVMGLCRVFIYVIAALTAELSGDVLIGALVLLAYLIGLTYAAKQENLAKFEGAWPLVLLSAPAFYVFRYAPDYWDYWPLLLLVPWGLHCVGLIVGSKANIGRAIGGLIAGISLVDAAIVAANGRWAVAVVCVLGFLLTLAIQRIIPGT